MNQTERLYFSEITEADAKNIVEWRSEPSVYCYFVSSHKITLEEHLNWYNNHYKYDEKRFDYIAFSKDDEQPIGVFGIKKLQEARVEVSCLLKPTAQGKGYAQEAIRWLIKMATIKWKPKAVVAEIHVDNSPSIKMVEKLGFRKERVEGNFVSYTKEI